jgi:hypothetical protein
MKRSEMVKLLNDVMQRIYTVQNIDSCEHEELADWLLTEIEKAGMLPPVAQLEGLGTKDCAWEKE